jgi:integrase
MARRMHILTATAVTKLATQPGKWHDGGGLYLQVRPPSGADRDTAKSWLFRFQKNGKARALGLGPFPVISLGEARRLAADARHKVALGTDPIEAKRAQVASPNGATFKECAKAYVEAHRGGWRSAKHAEQWEATVETYAYPFIGDKLVSAIDTSAVMLVLEPIWHRAPETASRVRGRIESVLNFAKTKGFRTGENPAAWRGHLQNLLPKKNKVKAKTHFAALPYAQLPSFMAELREMDGVKARALEFTILTAVRTDTALGGRWEEINGSVWTIAAGRMKAEQTLNVPLSDRATAILKELPRSGDFVFSQRGVPLPEHALLQTVKKIAPVTTHGMRATFKTWATEKTNFPREVIEAALAHTPDELELAYQRGDLFDKRRELLNAWAAYCGGEG